MPPGIANIICPAVPVFDNKRFPSFIVSFCEGEDSLIPTLPIPPGINAILLFDAVVICARPAPVNAIF